MKDTQNRYVLFSSMLLVMGAAFAACGGPDSRKVTRGPDVEGAAATSAKGGEGTGPSAGGSDSMGGDATGNPFGGNLFEGGAPPVVDGPPEVVDVDPKDAADDAEPNGAVSLLFSEGLDEATVTSANIKIMDGTTEVGGDLSYEGLVATFDPTRRLSLLAPYDVSVSQAVTDVGGTPLKAAFASQFKVRDGVWGKTSSAFDNTDNSWGGYQELGIDERGNALVVYVRYLEGHYRMLARWYRASGGWQDETPLDDGTRDSTMPKVAVDANGDAVVGWFSYDPQIGSYTVLARRYVGGVWEDSAKSVTNLDTAIFNSSPPPLGVAIGGGQVVVTWIRMEYVPQPFDYYYNQQMSAATLAGAWPDYPYYANSAAWSINESLVSPVAAVDSKGNALVVFGYNSPNMDPTYGAGVFYSRKAANGSWQYPTKIPSSLSPYTGPVLASDGDGAMAVWSTYDSNSNTYDLWGSRYTKAKQFVAGFNIGDPDIKGYVNLYGTSIVGNGYGFFTGWTQNVGNARNAYVNHYDLTTSKWDALPTPVSDGVANVGSTTSVGVDAHGNALVAYEQEGPNYTYIMMWSRLPAGGVWSAPDVLSPDDGMDESYQTPFVSVAGNGIAGVLFRGGGGHGIQQQTGGPVGPGQFRFFD